MQQYRFFIEDSGSLIIEGEDFNEILKILKKVVDLKYVKDIEKINK